MEAYSLATDHSQVERQVVLFTTKPWDLALAKGIKVVLLGSQQVETNHRMSWQTSLFSTVSFILINSNITELIWFYNFRSASPQKQRQLESYFRQPSNLLESICIEPPTRSSQLFRYQQYAATRSHLTFFTRTNSALRRHLTFVATTEYKLSGCQL